jgi:hypothetical protein
MLSAFWSPGGALPLELGSPPGRCAVPSPVLFISDPFVKARSIDDADSVRLVPFPHRGHGEIVKLNKGTGADSSKYSFSFQKDTYVLSSSTSPPTFARLPYPCSSRPSISTFLSPTGLISSQLPGLRNLYGDNELHIPIPSFTELFAEQATAPFFVFQVFCVTLWCLDEYWYYSLFTLFMLIMFECTVVWQASSFPSYPPFPCLTPGVQRVRTLTEFRTMSVTPYPIQCYRDGSWTTVQTDQLYPGDLVSISMARLLHSTAMLMPILYQHGHTRTPLSQPIFSFSMAPVLSTKPCSQESQRRCSKSRSNSLRRLKLSMSTQHTRMLCCSAGRRYCKLA